jgi:hypothetical protein
VPASIADITAAQELAAWCRIKDVRRNATHYDKLARNFASSVALAALII